VEQTASVDYGYLRRVVFDISRNVLDSSRDYLFDTRLTRILRNRGMAHLGELVAKLRAQKNIALEHEVAEAMTINETSFFRDLRPFDLLQNDLLPKLIESRRDRRALRLWSAACATGQEPYSLAMLLLDRFPLLAGWKIVIEGTDIASEAIERARAGAYHRIEINRGLPARYLVRFFDHRGEDWIVKPEVRRLCNFRHANLCGPTLPFARSTDSFDVIFLRNVMLYFDQPTRRKLLEGVHRLLPPDGVLFLGASEQPSDPLLWTPVIARGTSYFRPRPPSGS
jgi:chemotaxis protein methyltransferase CheR